MRNKKILIATYYWPPSGGAAVQRWLSFANNLSEAGWEVHILTVSEKWATYQLRDESLVAHIDPRITIHTTKTIEPFLLYKFLFGKDSIPKPAFSNETAPSAIKKLFRFIRGNLFIPDPRKGWKGYAVRAAQKVIVQFGIDQVITAGPPHSTHLIGMELKKTGTIKWIADFHDLWTDVIYYDMLYHLPFIKKWDARMEKTVLEKADHIITVGDKYKEKILQKSASLYPEKISVLRIGYDEKTFGSIKATIKSNAFIITYTGSIADFYQPAVFIYALKNVISKHPHLSFVLRFVGVLSNGIRTELINAGLQKYLDETGYVSHIESIAYLKNSSVLLLVNPVTKDEKMVIPGKLYEYLAAQKPIINITVKDAETARLIKNCNAGETFERNEGIPLQNYITKLLEMWQAGESLEVSDNECIIQTYSRKELTNNLIHLLNQ